MRDLLTKIRFKLKGGTDVALYESMDYLDAYRLHTDVRSAEDPAEAVGGLWDEVGQLQFDFLVRHGMEPRDTLLDIGCGTLRGGRHAIRYLDPGHYTGLELSAGAIRAGRKLLRDEGLTEKRPRLIQNDDLKFSEMEGETFDFLMAQSVFSHLKPEHIRECFVYVGRVLHPASVLFYTYRRADEYRAVSVKEFDYPFSFFEEVAGENGLRVEEQDDYDHPRGQVMVALRKA